MRIVYYFPDETKDQLFEAFAQPLRIPNATITTDISELGDCLETLLSNESDEAIVLIMCAQGHPGTGTVYCPHGGMTGEVFSEGIYCPPGSTTPWPGLRTILRHKGNNNKRFYFLATQCDGLFFTRAMVRIHGPNYGPNTTILGLPSDKTHAMDGMDMETKHKLYLDFINEIDSNKTYG